MSYQKKEKLKNKYKIFKIISLKKEFNKKDLSELLNMSFPTVTKYINEFLELNIIQEIGLLDGNHGRKSLTYRFNPDSLYSIGIKVEVNRISIILINLLGKEIKKIEIYNNFYNNTHFVEYIIQELKKFLYDFEETKKIQGIGISLPGIVDNETKIFKIGTNFKLFSKEMLLIEKEFNLPIYLINEANAGVLGENILSGYQYSNLGFISIDTGIGAGIILKDRLYNGNEFKAGEIGHMTIIPNGKKCSCGNKGCLEKYCSIPSLIDEFSFAFNIKNLSLGEIFSMKLHETPLGKQILTTYISYIGIAIRNFQLIFDLKNIIIGGEIVYYKDYFNFKELLEKEIYNNIFISNKDIVKLSTYGDSSNLLGAAFLSFKDFYQIKNII